MLEVLKKYSRLSKELRDRLASPEVLLLINELEVKYKTKLASVLMRVMTHDLDLAELEDHFVFTQKLERNMAQELAKILQAKIFSQFAEYLRVDSLKTEIKAVFNENIKTEMDVRINLIVDKARLSFASAVLNNRFREILRTNLIGIRDCINTKETLLKSIAVGGLGLSENEAEIVIKELKCNVDQVTESTETKNALGGRDRSSKIIPGQKIINMQARDVPYDLNNLRIKRTAEPLVAVEPSLKDFTQIESIVARTGEFIIPIESIVARTGEFIIPIPEPPSIAEPVSQEVIETPIAIVPAPIIISEPPILVPAPQSTQNGLTIFDKPKNPKAPEKPGFFENLKSILPDGHKENILNEDVDMIITKPNIKQVFGIINNRSKENGRIKVEDIRYITKTMGPIEELANLNLIDFRRLHQNPQTAIIKIKEKIELLAQDGYAKGRKGVFAWRKSPVNQTYLRIGQQSIAHGKSVGEVIKNLQSSNQDYLTEDEFEAVSELNNELKY